jgi:hypothetical protein
VSESEQPLSTGGFMQLRKPLTCENNSYLQKSSIFSHDRRVHRGYFLLPLFRDLGASALKIVADPSFGGSAVQIPSPCTEIALAELATQNPEYQEI